MTENNVVENATRAAEGLLEKGTFSLLDTVKDRTYPEKDVTIYTDMKSTHLRKVLEDEVNGLVTRMQNRSVWQFSKKRFRVSKRLFGTPV